MLLPFTKRPTIDCTHTHTLLLFNMYVAKVAIQGFSPYTYLCRLAGRSTRPPSLDEEEIILINIYPSLTRYFLWSCLLNKSSVLDL